ncbi:hypothetical protein [Paenibacillus naphthalenovorans]|uniref:hypothetical protein n=1 Tax=Paenibacillus naphthalenovorans TaxID=162209 RepID=UPI00089273EF|nr:hypothetical protein [Paenibacillus naphthalenovorans]SDJ79473.1 hypothetical protein SAMN05421868_1451 [Paenibacillus naphthalenovorans]
MIQNIIDSESTKHETLKMQFCWYAIFELGLPIDEVRKNITGDSYSDGAGKKAYMRELIAEMNELLESLSDDLNVTVRYIGNQKNQNIFHKASHNSARRAIGKK